jgi:hypothetical protein
MITTSGVGLGVLVGCAVGRSVGATVGAIVEIVAIVAEGCGVAERVTVGRSATGVGAAVAADPPGVRLNGEEPPGRGVNDKACGDAHPHSAHKSKRIMTRRRTAHHFRRISALSNTCSNYSMPGKCLAYTTIVYSPKH